MRVYKNFLAIIMLFFVIGIFSINLVIPQKEFSDSENRVLQQKPSFSMEKLFSGKFTSEYEKYITDQFVCRNFWVSAKSATETILQKKDNNGVYLGKNGYLLQKPNKIDKNLLNDNIEAINKFVSKNPNIKVDFLLAPNSVKILQDKLPKFATHEDEKDVINTVKNKLDQNIKFVDISDDLNRHKNEYIYYKTDHHWTTLGAYYAYMRLGNTLGYDPLKINDFNINKVTDEFYGTLYSKGNYRFIKPDFIEIFQPKKKKSYKVQYVQEQKTTNTLYETKHLNEKDKYALFLDGNHPLIKINTQGNNKRKLLVIKDSYAHSLVPFLTDHYNEIDMIDLRYFNTRISEYIKENNINEVLIIHNVLTFTEDNSISKIDF